MKEEVLFNLGGDTRVPDGLLNAWFASALADIQRDWRFGQMLTSSVLTVTADSPTVREPSNYGLLGIMGNSGRLTARSFYYARKHFLYPRSTGYPTDYWLQGSTIYFHPEPSNAAPDDWVDSTEYEEGDLVKDPTDGREYVCEEDHTGPGDGSTQPSVDSSHWALTLNGDFTCYYLDQDAMDGDEDSPTIEKVDDALIALVTARGFRSVGEPDQAAVFAAEGARAVKEARVWDEKRYSKVWSVMGRGS